MEKRFYIGLGLLLLLLAAGLWIGAGITRGHEPVAQRLEQAREMAAAGEVEQGARLVSEARQLWERQWKLTAAVTDHGPMDEIDGLFAALEAYAQQEDRSHFCAGCAQLANLVRVLGETHIFAWWNLL